MDDTSTAPEMDQELAQRLFKEGATLVMLDVPEGTEVGIDYNSWRAGSRFHGVKMIPPGVHFMYYRYVEWSYLYQAELEWASVPYSNGCCNLCLQRGSIKQLDLLKSSK